MISASAHVRPSHLLQDGFDMSPGFGLLSLAPFLAAACLLSRLNDRHRAMGLKQLSGIFMNFHFAHFHHLVFPRGGHPIAGWPLAECLALAVSPRRLCVFAPRPRR